MTANAGISSKGFSASVDDTFLKTKILTKISTENLSNLTDIAVSVSLGEVLLTGYSSDQISRLKLVENVMKTEGVKKVYNEVQINPTVSFTDRTEDALFESRLMTRMLFKSGINSNNFSLDVVSGNVYIIGLADNLEEKTTVESGYNGIFNTAIINGRNSSPRSGVADVQYLVAEYKNRLRDATTEINDLKFSIIISIIFIQCLQIIFDAFEK